MLFISELYKQVTFSLAVGSTRTVLAVTTKSIFVLESVLALFRVIKLITHLYTSDSEMHTLANREHPNVILHNATFHQGLHCLLTQKCFSEKDEQFHMENITCGLIYTMDQCCA